MSISSISNTTSPTIAQLFGVQSTTGSTSVFNDTASSPSPTAGGGRFATAIKDAFASLGVSFDSTASTSSTSSATSASALATGATTDTADTTTSTDSASDAVASFLQSLFAALHSQSAGSPPPTDSGAPGDGPPPVDGSSATSASSSASSSATSSSAQSSTDSTTSAQASEVGHAHHGHHGKLERNLQSLISDLTASSSTDGTSATTDTSSTSTSSDTTLSSLEQSFDAVLAQSGVTSTGNDTLTTFLQSLASKLEGAPSTGNVVSTAA
jgi:hypothetical protein